MNQLLGLQRSLFGRTRQRLLPQASSIQDVNSLSQYRRTSTDTKKESVKLSDESQSNGTKLMKFVTSRRGMLVIGGTTFAIVIGDIAYRVMHAFVHLDFYTVAEVGFVTGILTSASGIGFVAYFNRLRYINVENVLANAFDLVQQSPKVAELMGLHGFTFGIAQTGTIRAYQIQGGNFGISRTTGFPVWISPTVQLMFQVWGGSKEKQAIVCAEAYTNLAGQLKFTFISFDLLQGKSGFQGDNPTVIVYGDESKLNVRNDLRSFVTLNRVYVRDLN